MNQRRSVLFCLYLFWTESELSESYDGSVFRFLYPINTAVMLDKIPDLLFSQRVYRWCRRRRLFSPSTFSFSAVIHSIAHGCRYRRNDSGSEYSTRRCFSRNVMPAKSTRATKFVKFRQAFKRTPRFMAVLHPLLEHAPVNWNAGQSLLQNSWCLL